MGDRLVVAGGLTLIFTIGIVAVSTTGVVATLGSTQLLYLFQGLSAGNITLITIVLSINQLVISRELQAPGELQEQIENVVTYRDRAEQTTHRSPLPVTPSEFMAALLDGTRETAQNLGGTVANQDYGRCVAEVDAFVTKLTEKLDLNKDQLERSQAGIFSALASMLRTNFSHELHEAYRIQTVYGDELSSSTHDLLDEQRRSLRQLDIARQYFRSIYMQSELARLSRMLLYIGAPAVSSELLLLFTYTSVREPPLPLDVLEVLIPAVVILGFIPFAVLFSFFLRVATVAQRTVAITPFTTPGQESGLDDR